MLKNYSNKTNFLITAGSYKELEDFELQITSGDTPTFSIPAVDVPSGPRGHGRAKLPGSTLEHEQIVVRFIIDRELKSYLELYRWMLRINNYLTMHNTAQEPNQQPRFLQYHILNNIKTEILLTFNLIGAYPVNLGSLEYAYDEEGDMTIYGTVAFEFKRVELEQGGKIITK